MTEVAPDESVAEGGYEPELKRSLGQFQVFAISFAFMSVAVGVFGTYDDVLQNAGPVGIWLWVIAAVGQTLVALVIAQFAARISLSGSSYQWASLLANPRIGWGFGWLSFCYLRAWRRLSDRQREARTFREHLDHMGSLRRSALERRSSR